MTSSVQFVHFRVFDSMVGGYKATSGVTLGFKEVEPNKILYAVSYCAPCDLYNKATGRDKVVERLHSPEQSLTAATSFEEFVDICRAQDLHFQETYGDLLHELNDYLDIGLPMAYTEMRSPNRYCKTKANDLLR